jgi:hypothetical protein
VVIRNEAGPIRANGGRYGEAFRGDDILIAIAKAIAIASLDSR